MFDKLSAKQLKDIIREYKLTTQIKMSRLVDGKRKTYTKKELANELHNHLEIRDDGEIIYKSYSPMKKKYKYEEKKLRNKKVKEVIPEESAIIPYESEKETPEENVIIPYESKEEITVSSELQGLINRNKEKIKEIRAQLNEIDRTEYYPEIKNAIDDIAGDNPGSATRNFKKFLGITGQKISKKELFERVQKKVERNPPPILNQTLLKKNKLVGEVERLMYRNLEYTTMIEQIEYKE